MTLLEIQTAVRAGQTVHWASRAYVVIVDSLGQWFIKCGNHCIGLTHADNVTLNGKESDFFLGA